MSFQLIYKRPQFHHTLLEISLYYMYIFFHFSLFANQRLFLTVIGEALVVCDIGTL